MTIHAFATNSLLDVIVAVSLLFFPLFSKLKVSLLLHIKLITPIGKRHHMKDTFKLLSTLLFACIVLSSCQKEPELFDDESKMNIVFFEDDSPVRGIVKYNHNQYHCGQLRIVTAIQDNENSSAELEITILTNGEIVNVVYKTSHSSNFQRYQAPNMEAGKYFDIKNFDYNQSTKNLSFDFEGTVYVDSTDTKRIRGKVNVASVKQIDCTSLIFEARSISEDFKFSSISSNSSRFVSGPVLPSPYENIKYHIRSAKGQYLSLQMANDISELVGQEINFSTEDEDYRVIYGEYYGPMLFGNDSYRSMDQHWKYYQTNGKIKVIAKRDDPKQSRGVIYQGMITMNLEYAGTPYRENIEIPFEASSTL